MRDAYVPASRRPGQLSRRSLLRFGRPEPFRADWTDPCHAPLHAQLGPVAAVLAAEDHAHVSFFGDPSVADLLASVSPGSPVALAVWAPRGLPGALHAESPPVDLLEDPLVRTRSVQLRFDSPDACFAAMVPPDRRTVGVREQFDRLLAASNNRPPVVDLGARYLIVTGRRR